MVKLYSEEPDKDSSYSRLLSTALLFCVEMQEVFNKNFGNFNFDQTADKVRA